MSEVQIKPTSIDHLLVSLTTLQKVNEINGTVEEIYKEIKAKIPCLSTEEAIESFKMFLNENVKPNTRRSYEPVLKEFGNIFKERNIAEIPAIDLKNWLLERWGRGKSVKQRLTQLHWFFSQSIRYLQMKGMATFANPCPLIQIRGTEQIERPDDIPDKTIKMFLRSFKGREELRMIVTILTTSGMRVSELVGDSGAGKFSILKKDVRGRIIEIRDPKSGRRGEIAVIPEWLSEEFTEYCKYLYDDDKVFHISYDAVYDACKRHGKMVGLDNFTPHNLRKWIASFWNKKDEYSCKDFVLRHSLKLDDRYLSLSPKMVMEKQDKYLRFLL